MTELGPVGEPPEQRDNLTDRQRTYIRRVEEAHRAGRPYTGEPYDDRLDEIRRESAERMEKILFAEAEDDGPPDDDRWDWVETTFGGQPEWIKGQCNHLTPEPVDSYPSGELVRWLCVDCGQTFEPDRWPVPDSMWVRIPDPVLNSPEVPGLFTPGPGPNGFEKWAYGNTSPGTASPVTVMSDRFAIMHKAPDVIVAHKAPVRATTKVMDCLGSAWQGIKVAAEWAILTYAVWLVALFYLGILLEWWNG